MQKHAMMELRHFLMVLGGYEEAVQAGACVGPGFLADCVDENCSIGFGDAGF
jgi:hypothetical protein